MTKRYCDNCSAVITDSVVERVLLVTHGTIMVYLRAFSTVGQTDLCDHCVMLAVRDGAERMFLDAKPDVAFAVGACSCGSGTRCQVHAPSEPAGGTVTKTNGFIELIEG